MYEELVERLKIAAEWAGKGFCITSSLCFEAADAIEKLEKAVPRWTPVTERLPEESWERVLAYTDDGTVMTLPAIKLRNGYVRYWMPLPEPLKEE